MEFIGDQLDKADEIIDNQSSTLRVDVSSIDTQSLISEGSGYSVMDLKEQRSMKKKYRELEAKNKELEARNRELELKEKNRELEDRVRQLEAKLGQRNESVEDTMNLSEMNPKCTGDFKFQNTAQIKDKNDSSVDERKDDL